MNCFYHPGAVAVGICKSCGKGICHECAHDLGKGLACRGRCEDDAKALIALMARATKAQPNAVSRHLLASARTNQLIGAGFYLFLGFFPAAIGAYNFLTAGWSEKVVFMSGFGVALLLFGVIGIVRALRMPTVTTAAS